MNVSRLRQSAGFAVSIVLVGLISGSSAADRRTPTQDDLVEEGRRLYETACTSCHGFDGRGVEGRGPSLHGAGAAAADFYLTTGRMPMDDPDGQTRRKPPAFSPEEIEALVAYVSTFGDGPEIPDIRPEQGDLAEGQQLYTANCAACHNSAGSGGALGQAIYAPRITSATPRQVAEAIRIGPGAMPSFSEGALDDTEVASIQRYVEYLKDPEDPGGLPLGRLGPVPEGLVAWTVGIGALLAVARWLGSRS